MQNRYRSIHPTHFFYQWFQGLCALAVVCTCLAASRAGYGQGLPSSAPNVEALSTQYQNAVEEARRPVDDLDRLFLENLEKLLAQFDGEAGNQWHVNAALNNLREGKPQDEAPTGVAELDRLIAIYGQTHQKRTAAFLQRKMELGGSHVISLVEAESALVKLGMINESVICRERAAEIGGQLEAMAASVAAAEQKAVGNPDASGAGERLAGVVVRRAGTKRDEQDRDIHVGDPEDKSIPGAVRIFSGGFDEYVVMTEDGRLVPSWDDSPLERLRGVDTVYKVQPDHVVIRMDDGKFYTRAPEGAWWERYASRFNGAKDIGIGRHVVMLQPDGTVEMIWDRDMLKPGQGKVDLSGLKDVIDVAATLRTDRNKTSMCAAIRADGTLVAWDENGFFRLPDEISGGVTQICAKADRFMTLHSDGVAYIWERDEIVDDSRGLGKKVVALRPSGFGYAVKLEDGTWNVSFSPDHGLNEPIRKAGEILDFDLDLYFGRAVIVWLSAGDSVARR